MGTHGSSNTSEGSGKSFSGQLRRILRREGRAHIHLYFYRLTTMLPPPIVYVIRDLHEPFLGRADYG